MTAADEDCDVWNVKFIDPQTAARAMARINVGEKVASISGGFWKVLSKSAYGLLVQTDTNRITLPIQLTMIYREELDIMPRSPMPGARPRGRPPKEPAANAPAQIGPPQHMSAAVAQAEHGWTQPNQGDVAASAPPTVTIHEDWIADKIDELADNLKQEIADLIESAQRQALDNAPKPVPIKKPHPITCMDCLYIDTDRANNGANMQCGYYKQVVPMHVVCNPTKHCSQFTSSDDASADTP